MKINTTIMTKKLFISSLFLAVFFLSNCKKDDSFLPAQPEDKTTSISSDSLTRLSVAPSISSSAYDITKSLPAGYVKDASVDYTSYIQAAVNKYSEIVFPNFPMLINDKGIIIPSNRKIWFKSGGSLRLKPTTSSNYKMFDIKRRSNITIVGAVLVGDRQKHLGKTGEYGIGIKISQSNNINLYNPKVSQTWGDGIYIGYLSKDILVDKAHIVKAGRNGITIASGINIHLADPRIEYTDRIEPMSGIDIEPDGTQDELQNIKITNPTTIQNGKTGIQIGLSQFYYDQVNTRKKVSIEITNHRDLGSFQYGVWLSTAGKGTSADKARNIVSGSVKFINPLWRKNPMPIHARNFNENALELTILTPTVINTRGTKLKTNDVIALFKSNIGGVTKSINH